MAEVARPLSIRIQTDLDRHPDSPTPVQPRFQQHSPSTPTQPGSPTPTRTSHYRPFSTLLTQSPYVEIEAKKARILKRSSSAGGLHAMSMALHFNSKSRQKAVLPAVDTSKGLLSPPLLLSDGTPMRSSPPPSAMQRPMAVKKKRSMVSLFTSSSATSEQTPEQSPITASSSPISIAHPPSPAPQSSDDYFPRQNTPTLLKATTPKHVSFDSESLTPSERFVPKNIWAKRHNMKLHPYQQDVPYMQAYDPILLENDRYTDLLLQRLSKGSPSFHDYGKKPPASVLDLGCGPGHWILHASNVWKHSKFTGFDLVDVTSSAFETMDNVQFVQGDFVNHKLPFPNKFFEYVRMANLVLCIPYDRLEFLLSEVHRVLVPGGRLELIDDQIYFPYGEVPKDIPRPLAKPQRKNRSKSSFFDSDDEEGFSGDDEETLQGEDSGDTESTLNGSSEGSSGSDSTRSSFEDALTMDTLNSRVLSESATIRPGSPVHSSPTSSSPAFDLMQPKSQVWQKQAWQSRNLEKVFERMLKEKHGIQPRPAEFVLEFFHKTFGKERAGKTRSFHIKLAPVGSPIGRSDARISEDVKDVEEIVSTMKSTAAAGFDGQGVGVMMTSTPGAVVATSKRKPWEKQSKSKKEKENKKAHISKPSKMKGVSTTRAPPPTPPMHHQTPGPMPVLSAKAAGRLGISYSALAAATASSTPSDRGAASSYSGGPAQHPGILVWPSTYIPMGAAELEMHACKYVHTLLGCRPALAEFVSKQVDEQGTKLVGQEEFNEDVWDYECFRRVRFNWPSEASDLYEDDPTNPHAYSFPTTPTFGTSNAAAGITGGTNASTLEAPMTMSRSTSATGLTPSTNDMFTKGKTLRGTRSNLLLRSSPPKAPVYSSSYSTSTQPPTLTGNTPSASLHPFASLSRSSSPAPPRSPSGPSPSISPSHSRNGSNDSEFNGLHLRDDLVHLRTIRVFEAVKADVVGTGAGAGATESTSGKSTPTVTMPWTMNATLGGLSA